MTIRRVSVARAGPCLLAALAAACSASSGPARTVAAPPGLSVPGTTSVTVVPTATAPKIHTAKPKPKPKPKPRPKPKAKAKTPVRTGVRRGSSVPGVPALDMPDPRLTPGRAFGGLTVARICTPGYASSVRDVPASEKDAVYAEYHVVHVPLAHEVDHLVSLELGGSNDIRNLWPEPYAGRWNARVKDRLENLLHARVCAHALSLRAAQRLIARDWPAAYRTLLGSPSSAPSPAVPAPAPASGNAAGGYYTSAYATARTIYCADDPAWRRLSRTYLRHFRTFAAALAAFPRRHLHQPC